MDDDVEDFAEHRRKIESEKQAHKQEEGRAKWRRMVEVTVDLNKDLFAKNAFADAFVNILREVNRTQPGPSGASDLAHFFDMLDRGAKVPFGELTDAALERIRPSEERYYGNDDYKRSAQALLDVAMAGLAFLIENAATDQIAGTRKSKRQHNLIMAIRNYDEAHDTYRRKQRGSPPPRTGRKRRS
jgi:hypothetical protein